MNNEQKAQRYNYLLGEHTKISNQIQSIKGESRVEYVPYEKTVMEYDAVQR